MSTLTNIALSDIPTVVTIDDNFDILNNDKIEVGNIIQGENITFEINGKNITISSIGGTDGKNIEMRYSDTYLQYRLVGDLNWINLVQIESTVELSGRVTTLEANQGDLTSVPTQLQNKTIAEMITTNFTSGSNWKNTIANAITAKGVDTLATDTLSTFETNIGLISGGESGGIDEYTGLILHCEDFTDSSYFPKTVNNTGGVIATDGKFGSCINLSSGKLTIPMINECQFRLNDFTIDFWIKRLGALPSVASTLMYIGQGTGSGGSDRGMIIGYKDNSLSNMILAISSSGTGYDMCPNLHMGLPTLNEWEHYAIVRHGVNFYIFKNGAIISTDTSSLSIRLNVDKALYINNGWDNNNSRQNFKIDELRVSNGIARWIEPFTPPPSPYTVDLESYSTMLEEQIIESEYQSL